MTSSISRQDLIKDLQRVAEKIGEPPSSPQYERYGKYSRSSIYRHFDGIIEARKAAGLGSEDLTGKRQNIPIENLIDEIHALHSKLGRVPKREEMVEIGKFSEGPYVRNFGTWGDAVLAAGYQPYRPNKYNVEKRIFTCGFCGIKRKEKISENKNQKNWFCSKNCKDDWESKNKKGENHPQYNRISTECSWCGGSIEAKPSVFENRENMFCGHECAGKWWSENRVGDRHPRYTGGDAEVTCQACGEIYEVRRAKVDATRFCSYECMGRVRMIEMRGENNPNYNPDSIDETGPNWLEQRRKRIDKDNACCVACGMRMEEHIQKYSIELDVHHVFPRYLFNGPNGFDYESANEISNLRTMCRACHRRWEGIPLSPSRL
jgi:hypothetical protein